MELQRAADVAHKARNAEAHVLRVAKRLQHDRRSADQKAGDDHEPVVLAKTGKALFLFLH